MFEDSYLDSFMESHIGGWTGDEDYWYADDRDEGCDPYDDHDDHDDSPCDHWDDPDDKNIIGGYEPEDDPYASEWRDNDDYCDHY